MNIVFDPQIDLLRIFDPDNSSLNGFLNKITFQFLVQGLQYSVRRIVGSLWANIKLITITE